MLSKAVRQFAVQTVQILMLSQVSSSLKLANDNARHSSRLLFNIPKLQAGRTKAKDEAVLVLPCFSCFNSML